MPRAATIDKREVLPPETEDLEELDELQPPPDVVLDCLENHKWGLTFPIIEEDGQRQYKPNAKPRAELGFKAGKLYAVPAPLAIRLLRDYGPYRRKKGVVEHPVKFKAQDPYAMQEALNIMLDRKEAIEEGVLDRDQPVGDDDPPVFADE